MATSLAVVAVVLGAGLMPAQAALARGRGHTLAGGHELRSRQSIWSPNQSYQLLVHTKENLAECGPSGTVWATATPASGNHVTMQIDGNLIVYTSGGAPLWQPGTGCNSGDFILDLQNDDNRIRRPTPLLTLHLDTLLS